MTALSLPAGWRPHTILVWHHGALGDTILGFPALRVLRDWAPDAHVTVVGRPSYLTLGKTLGLLDAIEDSDGSNARSMFRDSPRMLPDCDLAVIWSSEHSSIAHRIANTGTQIAIGAEPRARDSRHQATYLIDTLKPLGIEAGMRASEWESSRRISQPGKSKTVIVHPGAGSRWKRWPVCEWLTVANTLIDADFEVVWTCGPDDTDLLASVRRGMRGHAHAYSELTTTALAALIEGADLLVSSDTGPAHLAALLGIPTVTMFGPTDPSRWRPLGPDALVVAAPDCCGGTWSPLRTGNEKQAALVLRRCIPGPQLDCACLSALQADSVLDACFTVLR